MRNDPITGGCYCGNVRYAAGSQPFHQANCHCQNCRRAIGAQAVAWITVKVSDFRYEKAKPSRYQTETGAWRTFCSHCGTSLTYEHDGRPDEIDITTASLDRPEEFAPTRDVFPEEKLPWTNLVRTS
jgi:hypothetical protein